MADDSRGVPPVDPLLAAEVAKLPPEAEAVFQERAAILEYEAGFPRAEAEARALAETLRWLQDRRAK